MVLMHIAGSAMGRLSIANRGRAMGLLESGRSAREVARTNLTCCLCLKYLCVRNLELVLSLFKHSSGCVKHGLDIMYYALGLFSEVHPYSIHSTHIVAL